MAGVDHVRDGARGFEPIVQFDLTEGRFSAREASLYAAKNDARDLAAKIVELLDDPQRRAEMGAYGRSRVENELEWRFEVPKLLAAYEMAATAVGTRLQTEYQGTPTD